jgi:hypothetical protein
MLCDDPYKAEPGPELDALIHQRVMKNRGEVQLCPAYSSDDKAAKRVLTVLRSGRPSVIVGRTSLPGRTWYARFERDTRDGTEVFADSFALAICRLALLRFEDVETGSS